MKYAVITDSKTKSKNSIYSLAALVFVVLATLTGCNTPSEKVEKAQENVTEAKTDLDKAEADYTADMEKYRKETDERIAANQKSIDEFNERISKEKKEARKEYREKIDALNEKNRDMKKRLDDYKGEGNEKWQSFKREFNHDMDELGNAVRDIGKNNVK